MRHLSRWARSASGRTRAVLVAAVFTAVGLTALIPVIATPRTAQREIVLVTRDMAFYLEGSNTPNPTLVLRRGEEVRVIVRNQESGITHGFGVASLGALVDQIDPGATESLWLQAPADPGRHEYVCPPHAQMMRGVVLVTE